MNNTKEKGSKLLSILVTLMMLLATFSILLIITTPVVKAASPTIAITDNFGGATTKDPVTFTFTFSELVWGFTVADVVVTGGTTAVGFATGINGDAVYTLVVTPTAATQAGTITVNVAAGVAQNDGHEENTIAVEATQNYDTLAPTLALTYSADPAKAGALTVTATYSEAIVGTPTISIDQPGTTDITTVAMSGGATIWTYGYTVYAATGGTYVDGVATVSLSTVADAANSNAGVSTGTTFTIDTTAPIAALTYSADPAKAGALTVTATYSEAIVGTPTISIDQPGTTDITTVAMSGGATIWTYGYTVYAATGGTYVDGVATVSLSTVADAANNNAGVSTGTTFTIDTTTPTVFLSSATANPTNGLIAVTAEFSETVTGFTISNITVTGGIAETFVAVDGNTYTFNVNPINGASVAVTIQIAAGVAQDAATNTNTISNTLSYISDTVAPSLLYTVLDADHNGNHYTYVDVHFSENVVNTTIATTDFSIGNASATVSTFYNDGNTALVTLKLSSKLTGNGPTISVVGAINDSAGNTLSSAGPITINTYRVNLNESWNMFSIPADVSNIGIPTLLTSIWSNVDRTTNILWYNASANTWKYYSVKKQSGTLTAIEPGKAYWIHMNASDTLIGNYSTVLHGTNPPPIVELTGHRWNMMGTWATYNQTANRNGGLSSLFDVLNDTGEILYKYTRSGGFGPIYGNSTTKMQPGDGFWLYLRTQDNGYYTLAEP